jgi:hypothetical protein
VPTSTLDRDLNLRPLAGDTAEPGRPSVWTADWVKHRMVEAFTIERRIPGQASWPGHRQGRLGEEPGAPTG